MEHDPALESVARRRQRLAARRDVPPPPSADPAHGRALRARSAATDREQRFAARLDAVRADADRRARRAKVLVILAAVGTVGVGVGVALVAAIWLAAPVAAVAGILVAVAVHVGRRTTARLAAARGAEAWDWQAGRHRLLGRPAARVQQADAPPPTDPRR